MCQDETAETDETHLDENPTCTAIEYGLEDAPTDQRRRLYNVEKEVPNQWLRFHGYNTGIWNGFWADNTRLRKQDNDAMLDAIASQLGMSKYQRERARYLLHDFRFSEHSPYYRVIHVTLIACLLVVNEDYDGKGMVYYPTRKYDDLPAIEASQNPEDPFRRLIDSLGLSKRKV